MVRAKCPYCGTENDVGLQEVIHPGNSTPWMKTCPHYVFDAPTRFLGAHFAEQEFGVNLTAAPEIYSLEADMMGLLNAHFKFFGSVAFAPDENAIDAANREVGDFLRARKILK